MAKLALQVIHVQKGIVDYHFCKLIVQSPSMELRYG